MKSISLLLSFLCLPLWGINTYAQTDTINFNDAIAGTIIKGEKKSFTFYGSSGTTVRIRYYSYYPNLELISPSGKVVFTDVKDYSSYINTDQLLIESGTYTIVAYKHSSSASDSYSLGMYQIIPPVNSTKISADTVTSGTLKNCELKIFTFNGTNGTTKRIRYYSYYPNLELISPSGKVVFTDVKDYSSYINTDQLLTESGTYTIIAYKHSSSASDSYSLGLYQIIPPVNSTKISADTVTNGTLKNCEIKLFTFNGTSGTTKRICYYSYYPNLELISPSGKVVFTDAKDYSSYISTDQLLTESGTYTIVAYKHSSSASDSYSLGMYQIIPPVNSTKISADTVTSGTLKNCELKIFTFNGTNGTTKRIRYYSYYPNLELISPSGKVVFADAKDYSSYINIDQLLTESGIYTILAYKHTNNTSDTYNLGLYQITPPINSTKITTDTVASGTLKNCELRIFTFNGINGTTQRICYYNYYPNLELISPSGKVVFTDAKDYSSYINTDQLLTESGIYTILAYKHTSNSSDSYKLGLYQTNLTTTVADTLSYNKKYTSTLSAFSKKVIKFKGTKDATIRLGYGLDYGGFSNYYGYNFDAVIFTPNNDTLYNIPRSGNNGVKELKLPSTGDYTLLLSSRSTSDYSNSFWLYQTNPATIVPDTLSYNKKYTSTLSAFSKKVIKLKGTKDATIRLGYGLDYGGFSNYHGYNFDAVVFTPNNDTLYNIPRSGNNGVKELKLPSTGDYTLLLSSRSTSDYSNSFWLYQTNPATIVPDTLSYNKKYTSTLSAFSKKVIKFKGTKDATIRLGYGLDYGGFSNYYGYNFDAVIFTPNNDTLYNIPRSGNNGVKELKLPSTGDYTLLLSSRSTSDYSNSFWLYQTNPATIVPDTLSYNKKYTSTLSAFSKKVIKLKGTKDATIRLGYGLDYGGFSNYYGYNFDAVVFTPNNDTLYNIPRSGNNGVKELKLPSTGDYTLLLSSRSTSDYSNSFWLYQTNPATIVPDTLSYNKKYTSTLSAFSKKVIKFKGTKDATIRLGYGLDYGGFSNYYGYNFDAVIFTPNNDTLYNIPRSGNNGVKELKLPSTGDYTLLLSSRSTSDYSNSFWINNIIPITNAIEIKINEAKSGNLANFYEMDSYKFLASKGDTVVLRAYSSNSGFTPRLYLISPNDSIEIITGIKGTAIREQRILKESGYYGLVICGAESHSSTDYTIQVLGHQRLETNIIDDAEYKILKDFYNTSSGISWTNKWDISSDTINPKNWYGVSFSDGHVTSISLPSNQLRGDFPVVLFTLSKLRALNLYDNQLTGKIDSSIVNLALLKSLKTDSLTSLNLGKNLLKGQIPTLFNAFSRLLHLNLEGNKLSSIVAPLPTHITDLNLQNQEIAIDSVKLSITPELNLPSLCTYNHGGQSFDFHPAFSLLSKGSSIGNINYSGNKYHLSWINPLGWTYESGQPLVLRQQNGLATGTNSIFKLFFKSGDANIDQQVDILDVQHSLNYLLSDNPQPFNFSAADTYKDTTITVQDIVRTVNIILSSVPDTTTTTLQKSKSAIVSANHLYIENNNLVLDAEESVSAMDITLLGISDKQFRLILSNSSFQMVARNLPGGGTRFIVFSPTGNEIKAGKTIIAELYNEKACLSRAKLSDKRARIVSVSLNKEDATGLEYLSDLNFSVYTLSGKAVVVLPTSVEKLRATLYTVQGIVLDDRILIDLPTGKTIIDYSSVGLCKGVYILKLSVKIQDKILNKNTKLIITK